jgi:ubiquinone/menaquinone biosynthesis C-methylase UbiE
MRCRGGFVLDEATRRSWYNPQEVLKGLRSGMVFADVGCGDGFFSVLAAKKVREKGKVYAVDTDASAIEKLLSKANAQGLKNIYAKIGSAEETVFCGECVDFVFYSMVLHDFYDPAKVLKNAKRMVRPGGRLVDLDWKKQEMPFGPPFKIRFSREQASGLIENAGFQVETIKDAGNYHYVLTARPLP